MLTSLGTSAIINGARLSLCRIAMVDARSVPRYDVLTKVGFVIWERGPMSRRVASCLLLLMATEMRPSGVHVACAHGMDDSERAGTVNTHCWKVAWVVFVSSDKGAQWANMYWGASGILELAGVWWFRGRVYSRLSGTCACSGCSVVRDTCVLVTVEPTVVSLWLVFCLSTSLAQWFNKYHAGLEVMGSIPMGDFHI